MRFFKDRYQYSKQNLPMSRFTRDDDINRELRRLSAIQSDIQSTMLKKDGSVSLTNNWDVDGAGTLFIDKTNGNVGIGTTSPTAKLNVDGDVYFGSYSKSTNGYTKLPNELILQWGHYEKSSPFADDEEITITFPISFPNALLSFSAIVSAGTNGTGDTYAFFSGIKQNSDGSLYNFSQSSITVEVWHIDGQTPANGKGHLFWFAIGY